MHRMNRANEILKTRPMRILEARIGRPIEDYIAERYAAGDTQAEIGRSLEVNAATISRYMRMLGIEARFPGQRAKVA